MYPIRLFINGEWRDGSGGETIDIVNPATGGVVGTVAVATRADLDDALACAEKAFSEWSGTSAFDRYKLLRKAADLLRARTEDVARLITIEQGKPLGEARLEIGLAIDVIDWCAEEARRTYGRVIPARLSKVRQVLLHEPVGPVAAFTPWNFPVSQLARKLGAALAAGCSIIAKASEETPASAAAIFQIFADAGLPAGVANLVFGVPADISGYLVPHPVIRKISFTGSVPVGKHLAGLAGSHMKPATMELGGHAPVFVFDDTDVEKTAATMTMSKFRNAGQVCVSPTRFLVQDGIYDEFVERFVAGAKAIRIGNGLDADTVMGPVVSERRLTAIDALVQDAADKGARVLTGGRRHSNQGSFYEPTVLADLSTEMRIMNEEPFGPLALICRFSDIEEAISEANRLPYGLASYAFSRSQKRVDALMQNVKAGMMTVNHLGIGQPETHFGGVRDSGYGSEGGPEAVEAYLVSKFVTIDPTA
ncbi:MAG: NAD-dependent succinate-semialdehyde dehydrogenase [Rhizobiaceae bacterium]|nr:NAD-dependent succinate-semialdehyde dehydrogenase [Rhizobiaceae bacterium]